MKNVKILLDNDIDFYSSLELLGDVEMYDETLSDFYDEIDNSIEKLQNFFKQKDLNNYAIVAHDLKSNSKYLGFKSLAEISYNHEIMGKADDKQYIEANYAILINEIKRIKNIIKEYLESDV